ncbi:hypothetical protein Gasu2_00720 [Galdieria sulphuraria]|nr:hypothetical protein Gasu2_00720 [Galdieria sulphuraria]
MSDRQSRWKQRITSPNTRTALNLSLISVPQHRRRISSPLAGIELGYYALLLLWTAYSDNHLSRTRTKELYLGTR